MESQSSDEISEGSYTESLSEVESVPFHVKVILFYRRLIFFHPIILAPLLTVSLILALFSGLNCDFIVISIGFQPLNDYVESKTLSICPLVGEFHEGCYLYSNDFKDAYISNDKNWAYAMIASLASIGSGFLTFTLIWMMFLGGVDHINCPKTFLEFLICVFSLAECGKLLWFKKIDVCRAKMWVRKAVDGVSIEVANSCEFGKGAKLSLSCFLLNISALVILYYVDQYRPYEDFLDMKEDLESCGTENGTMNRGRNHTIVNNATESENEAASNQLKLQRKNLMRRVSSESVLLDRVSTPRQNTRRTSSEKNLSVTDEV